MNQDERFNNIFDECLDRLIKGETVEQCLDKYPEYSRELGPLLRTAMAARVASTIQPRSEFKSRARYEFQSALREMEEKKSARSSLFAWRWQSGWAIALVVLIVVVLGGGSTAVVASNSMPDSKLYSVKLTTEQIQLALSSSDVGKAELNSQFADRRAGEIVYVASKGDVQEVRIIAQRMNTNLQNITDIVRGTAGAAASQAAPKGTGGPTGPMLSVNSSPPELNAQSSDTPEPMMGVVAAPAAPPSADNAAPAPASGAPPPTLTPAPAPAAPPAKSPAATTAPAATEPSRSMAAPVPAPTIAPVPAVRPPAPEVTAAPQAESPATSENQDQKTITGVTGSPLNLTEREQIKKIVIEAFNTRQALLEKALAEASPEVRPAIRQAIAQSLAEYETALSQLE